MQSDSPFGAQDSVQTTVEMFGTRVRTNYVVLSSLTIVTAEFLRTLPDEVRLMWPIPLSLPKALFFTLRYYHVVAHSVFGVLYSFPRGYTPEQCAAAFLRRGISSIAIAVASEAILFIRVYAFSGGNKKLLTYLAFQFIAIHASAFALFAKFYDSVKFTKLPIEGILCMSTSANSLLLSGVFALLLASVLIVMFIMMYLAFRKHRFTDSKLMTVFYRDGVVYFLLLSVLAIGNVTTTLRAPTNLPTTLLLTHLEIDAHALLATRMLVHLRACAERDACGGGETRTSSRGSGCGNGSRGELEFALEARLEFSSDSSPGRRATVAREEDDDRERAGVGDGPALGTLEDVS